MGFLDTLLRLPGHAVDRIGDTFNLPEFGLSEKLGVHNGANIIKGDGKLVKVSPQPASSGGGGAAPTGGSSYGGGSGAGGGGASNAKAIADTLSFLGDQANQLNALLGRSDTALSQALQRNTDEYDRNVGAATNDRDTKVTEQNQAKLQNYETINRNAGTGFRSLAQIIGRAAGTGSSAFREALPDVIGKDTSSKRQDTSSKYGQNLSKIEGGFQGVLSDLLRQRKENEERARTGIEERKQSLLGQLSENAGKQAEARGGGYAQVKAAQNPLQARIDASRNAVESFFNDFRTPYARQELNPDLDKFTADRSQINAGAQPGGGDPSNPYATLLRKKLEQGGVV